MSIHAKSLNQLAYELERRDRTQPVLNPQRTVQAPSPKSVITKELAELKKFVEDLRFSPVVHAPVAESTQAVAPTPQEIPPEPDFHMNSTLGTRFHATQVDELRTRESELRFYSGFVSRAGINGE